MEQSLEVEWLLLREGVGEFAAGRIDLARSMEVLPVKRNHHEADGKTTLNETTLALLREGRVRNPFSGHGGDQQMGSVELMNVLSGELVFGWDCSRRSKWLFVKMI